MSKMCFKIKSGTLFDKEVKKHFELLDNWKKVFEELSEYLGETITELVFTTETLIINPEEITHPDIKKLFRKDGRIKSNSNKAKEVLNQYRIILAKNGLEYFKELRMINFVHGVTRRRGEDLESFRTSDNGIYYKASFDLEKRSNGCVVPISEIEYEETYLNELKKRESNNT